MLKRMCTKSPFVPKLNDVVANNKACVNMEKQNLGSKQTSAQFRSLTITTDRNLWEVILSKTTKILRPVFWRHLLACKCGGHFLGGPCRWCKCILWDLTKTFVCLLQYAKTMTKEFLFERSLFNWWWGQQAHRLRVHKDASLSQRYFIDWGLLYSSLCFKSWQICLNKKQH